MFARMRMRLVRKPFPDHPISTRNDYPPPRRHTTFGLKTLHKASCLQISSTRQGKFQDQAIALQKEKKLSVMTNSHHIDETSN